ncbi:HIT family protein [Brevibacillus ruminantium]|uniref:HIT family protein n=1 Tax=Brevibacillus ruminantium TaxID=2950604 RepID=A0ABY4W9N8_9BACL|nr:HIT family protein [Brevibacillus ruminantium]USG63885.1 HIT family protein [Brevibacillus ruminantium]
MQQIEYSHTSIAVGNCVGCHLALGFEAVHTVYENDRLRCILDIDPFAEGHTLVLPKEHVKEWSEMDDALALAVIEAIQKVSAALNELYQPDGITVCQNGGRFSDLNHFHLHIIPRFQGDGFAWSEPIHLHGAEERLAETREKIAAMISSLQSR